VLPPEEYGDFKAFMLNELNARVEILESIETEPDRDEYGHAILNTGGRTDLFFCVHDEDIGHFAIPRLSFGIRWIEDAISETNGGNRYYPEPLLSGCFPEGTA
jgi:hypothetical protein